MAYLEAYNGGDKVETFVDTADNALDTSALDLKHTARLFLIR